MSVVEHRLQRLVRRGKCSVYEEGLGLEPSLLLTRVGLDLIHSLLGDNL